METERRCEINDIDDLLSEGRFIHMRGKKAVKNLPIAFDIEVSSFYDGGEKRAVQYAWVLGINGKVIFGRTWEEALIAFAKIEEHLHEYAKDKEGFKAYAYVYVHNLAYEFQWLRKLLRFENVFALSERDPLKAVTKGGIEFRCSFHLSNYSLAVVSRNLFKYKVRKLVGDLDYSLVRFPSTPLTKKEWGYIRNDGLVVMAYIQELIEQEGDITKIPLTQTGFVRRHCRNACLYGKGTHQKDVGKFNRYHGLMVRLTLEPDEYSLLRNKVFQGGYTHASFMWSGFLAEKVCSYDFTSSYPAVMVMEKFPMSKGRKVIVKSLREFKEYTRKYCCVFECEFTDLESTCPYEHYLSLSKCDCDNPISDNGRIERADRCATAMTEVDFAIVKNCYTWSDFKVWNFWIYEKDYLPVSLINAILDLYGDKTTLKGVKGYEREYSNSKEKLNACYGMTVTDICRDSSTIDDDGEWVTKKANLEDEIKKYNDSKSRFLFYPWGIYVTAYARRNLWSGILRLGKSDIDGSDRVDYIYSDTDSLKFVHPEHHLRYFDEYNRFIESKIKRVSMALGIPLERFMPKTKKGIAKMIGAWDYEGRKGSSYTYSQFKTLGAKRYMTRSPDTGLSLTISGVNKKFGVPYLLHRYGDANGVFGHFNDSLIFPASYISPSGERKTGTGKSLHSYLDEPFEGEYVDYLGNPCHYEERSGVHMEATEYTLSLSLLYLEYLKGVKEIRVA